MVDPIFVVGCARSGTSMVAGCIHSAGIWGGVMQEPNQYNKKGMFENLAIRDVIKSYLSLAGADQLAQRSFPDINNLPEYPNLKSDIEFVLRKEGLRPDQRWFYKCTKMPLIWVKIAEIYPNAKWVIVRRPDEQIIQSNIRTPFMRHITTEEYCQSWLNHFKGRFKEMTDALDCMEVWSDQLVKGNISTMEEVFDWLGISVGKQVFGFIDPMLYNSK